MSGVVLQFPPQLAHIRPQVFSFSAVFRTPYKRQQSLMRQIGQLPLNFRATTTSPLAALAASSDVQQDSSGNFEVGGATTDMVGFSVDGVSTVNVFQRGVSLAAGAQGANPYPSSEGISELKVTRSIIMLNFRR